MLNILVKLVHAEWMLVDGPRERVNAFREKVAAFHRNAKVAPLVVYASRFIPACTYVSVLGEDS